jgi:hypothetical protein
VQAEQLEPHAVGSVSRTQMPPQLWYPGLHAKLHVPALHNAAAFDGAVHVVQLEPQWDTSACVSAQVRPHIVVPAGQADMHAYPVVVSAQTSVGPVQLTPHPPH